MWQVNPDTNKECYADSTSGCYGLISGYVYGVNQKNPSGYVLETRVAKCNGIRGNICGSLEGVLKDGELRCGVKNDPSSCNRVNSDCNSQLSWGLVDKGGNPGNEGWCYGTMGCANFCSLTQGGSIVQVDINFLQTPKENALNTYAKLNYVQDLTGKLDCGCKLEY